MSKIRNAFQLFGGQFLDMLCMFTATDYVKMTAKLENENSLESHDQGQLE